MPDADGQLAPDAKGAALREALGRLGSAVVAFSGGVDSTFLLRVAHDVLGDNAIAVTARLSTVPDREINEAAAYCRALGVRHEILDFDAFAVPGFAENSPDRCYFCKKALFTGIRAFAEANGCAAVLEGSNRDDDGDFRPGRRALRELGVLSPLRDAGLGKTEIRILSAEMGLPTASKPSFACLATRFPYGECLTPEGTRLSGPRVGWLGCLTPEGRLTPKGPTADWPGCLTPEGICVSGPTAGWPGCLTPEGCLTPGGRRSPLPVPRYPSLQWCLKLEKPHLPGQPDCHDLPDCRRWPAG